MEYCCLRPWIDDVSYLYTLYLYFCDNFWFPSIDFNNFVTVTIRNEWVGGLDAPGISRMNHFAAEIVSLVKHSISLVKSSLHDHADEK